MVPEPCSSRNRIHEALSFPRAGAAAGCRARAGPFCLSDPQRPGATKNSAQLIFSDNLKPDPNPKLLEKITQTELFARDSKGKYQPLKHRIAKDVIQVEVPASGTYLVAGTCKYGVTQRGQDEPFLLLYHPKTFVGLSTNWLPPKAFFDRCERLPLEIEEVREAPKPTVRVLWQGKPLEGAEVAVLLSDRKGPEGKTDKAGLFSLDKVPLGGLIGIRARHEEKKQGELEGKKYQSIRHYATLLIPGDDSKRLDPIEPVRGVSAKAEPVAQKPDPAATKLLADARAARADWHNFPGFAADLEVNVDGKVSKTRLSVTAKGEVEFKLEDEAASKWARQTLGSLVSHRMDTSGREADSQCCFSDNQTDHPLGRAITVLDDEFHSSYRIRDRQVIVVNRTTKQSRFTITVLENMVNQDKLFLPVSYVVNYWDLKGEALKRSEAHHDSWKRVGKFDLPTELLVVIATPTGQEARSIKLTNHQLGSK